MIYGILLAAWKGRRIGMPKALLTLGGESLHHLSVGTLRGAGLEVVTVVNPFVNGALPPPDRGERRVSNPDPDQATGMFSSVRLGVSEVLRRGGTGALLLPVDHPLVTVDDLRAVAACLRAGAAIVVPAHAGRRGHPVGLSGGVMAEVLTDRAAATLRDIVRKDPARVIEAAASEGVLIGINTKEDLERVSNRTFR